MEVQQRVQAGHQFGDVSPGVQGQPAISVLELIRVTGGQVTLLVEVVNPVLAYDSWRPSLVDSPSKLEYRLRIEVLLSGLLSFRETEDNGMDVFNCLVISLEEIKTSRLESLHRRSGRGSGLGALSLLLLSYFGRCSTIL